MNSAGVRVCRTSLCPLLTLAAQRTTRWITGPGSQRMWEIGGEHQAKAGSASVQMRDTCCGTRSPALARNWCTAINKGASSMIIAVGGVTRKSEPRRFCSPSGDSSQSGRLKSPVETPRVANSSSTACSARPGPGLRRSVRQRITSRRCPRARRWRVALIKAAWMSGPAAAIGRPSRLPKSANAGTGRVLNHSSTAREPAPTIQASASAFRTRRERRVMSGPISISVCSEKKAVCPAARSKCCRATM